MTIKKSMKWLEILPLRSSSIYKCLSFLILILCLPTSFASDWVPVKDGSLMIEEGSILDFSNLVPHPKTIESRVIINSQGHFSLENDPEKSVRFLIGSLGFVTAHGGFPSHAITDAYVTQFRMHGYNMARLDFVEDTLMEGRAKDFDYNPEQLDRFYYLVAALKRNGIYLMLNGITGGNGAYGNISERWIGQKGLGLGVYFETEKQAHWKKLIATIYGSVNPYTGVTILKDPTLAGLILVNEGGLVMLSRQGVSDTLKPHFSKWLKAKYGSNKALKVAWGSELKADENFEKNQINFPKPDAWTSRRMSDLQQFFGASEKTTADWMTQYLRQLGYTGSVTSFDNWQSPAAQASRAQFDWVDMHDYFAEPSSFVAAGSVMRQDSLIENHGSYVRTLMANKHLGKAYTVSEFGQVFWNKYRRESGLAIPAYAALQSWDGICQHSTAVELSYSGMPGQGRKDIIYPFGVGLDPISRATETLAALLYLRGDVAPAQHTISVKLTPQDAYDNSAHLGNTPNDISKLALVTGLGLNWQSGNDAKTTQKTKKIPYDAQMEYNKPGIVLSKSGINKEVKPSENLGLKLDNLAKKYTGGLAYKISKVKMIADDRWSARVKNLRDAQLIGTNNLTNAEEGIYQSDTGEIILNSQQKKMTVITPKTEAIVFDELVPINLNNLSVLSADSAALVAVSSMDDQPLATSKRMLLVLSTDARNTDMRFSDDAKTTLLDLGKKPVLVRSVKIKLALKNINKSQLKVFSTNLSGQRQDAIKLKQTDTTIEFELDTGKLTHGATTYFEISV
ncbi:MAG TPA: hypothetical protein VES38_01215 [Methylotenera sp.]|nr:hypothetical protein [Methylotenera sp.]